MSNTPIKQLRLSVRASNVMQRMGIQFVEELVATPLEEISNQRNIGVKTLNEIKAAIKSVADSPLLECEVEEGFSDEQLAEMARHSIDELGLSVRPYHALTNAGHITIAQIATLDEPDFAQMKSLILLK